MNDKKIPKDKFSFVQIDTRIHDIDFETKSIGYFRDAWQRFRKNKASVVAFIILVVIVFLAIFGPYMNHYTILDQDTSVSYLPPRIPIIEKLGILDGTKIQEGVPVKVIGVASEDTPFILYDESSIVSMSDPYEKEYCQGTRCYTQEEVDIKYNEYINKFGPEEITINREEYLSLKANNPNSILIDDPNSDSSDPYKMYVITVNYAKYLGYEDIPYFWFGTDTLGRDMWTLLWNGARTSLLIGLFVAVVSIVVGIIYGSICGYYGGNVDLAMQRFIEILSGVPFITLMFIIRGYLGPTIFSVALALVITSWIGTSRMVRSQFYRYKGREYVLASRTLGAKDRRLIFRHILPNAIGPIITSTILIIPYAIFTEAIISYLGLGLGSGNSIGILLNNGQSYVIQFPHITVVPAIFISILMIAFNLFGNGLRDALNPSLRGVE